MNVKSTFCSTEKVASVTSGGLAGPSKSESMSTVQFSGSGRDLRLSTVALRIAEKSKRAGLHIIVIKARRCEMWFQAVLIISGQSTCVRDLHAMSHAVLKPSANWQSLKSCDGQVTRKSSDRALLKASVPGNEEYRARSARLSAGKVRSLAGQSGRQRSARSSIPKYRKRYFVIQQSREMLAIREAPPPSANRDSWRKCGAEKKTSGDNFVLIRSAMRNTSGIRPRSAKGQ